MTMLPPFDAELGAPAPGYYPDPSIPGYVRYWDGARWVPGTSRPKPAPGEELPPPRTLSRRAPLPLRSMPPPPSVSLEESGPVFLDETSAGLRGTGIRQVTGTDAGAEPGAERSGSGWQADARRQRGLLETRSEPRWVSWGVEAEPRPTPAADDAAPERSGPAPAAPAVERAAETPAEVTSWTVSPPGRPQWRPAPPVTGEQEGAAGVSRARRASGAEREAEQDREAARDGEPAAPNRPSAQPPGTDRPARPAPSPVVERPGAHPPAPVRDAPAPSPVVERPGALLPGTGIERPGAVPAGSSNSAITVPRASWPAAHRPVLAEPPAGVPSPSSSPAAEPGAGAAPAGARTPGGGRATPPTGTPAAGTGTAAAGRPAGSPAQDGAARRQPQPAAPAGAGAPARTRVSAGAGSPARPGAPARTGVPGRTGAPARTTAGARPAPLARRLAARLVDAVVTAAAVAVVAVPEVGAAVRHLEQKIAAARDSGATERVWLVDPTVLDCLGVLLAALLVAGLLLEALPTAAWGCTLGKRLLRLRVLDQRTREVPGVGRATARWLWHQLLVVFFPLALLTAALDRPLRRSWHDRLARTFVTVRR